jgi:predicted nucleotide-binding protein (sugar kinase/HSP70/actin superfamily)
MPIMDMFRVNDIKAELARTVKERDSLKKALQDTDKMEYHQLKQAIDDLCVQKEKARQETQMAEGEYAKRRRNFDQQLAELAKQLDLRKKEVIVLDEEILLESFALYKSKFKFLTSEECKVRLDVCREKQKQLIKSGKALNINENWAANNKNLKGHEQGGL